MDELTSMAIWFLVIIFSINLGVIYLANTETFKTTSPELSLSLAEGTYFKSYSFDTNSSIGTNTISSDPITITFVFLKQMVDGTIKLFTTISKLFTAWSDLLKVVLVPVPGGEFFVQILTPIIGLVQIVAVLILFIRGAGVIRGVV